MPSYDRIDRISEEVKRELDTILRTSVKDPRIPTLFTLTNVQVTRDLSFCKVGISTMLDEQQNKEMLKALKSAAGFIRHELGQRVMLRHLPALLFYLDNNIAYGVHIAQVLNTLDIPKENEEDADEQ